MKNELLLIIKKFFNEIDGLKNFFPPINSAGYPFIIIFIIFSFLLSIFSDFLGWIGVILTIWCVYFFRDPDRVIPKQKNILISPADGKILTVDICKSPKNFSDLENDETLKLLHKLGEYEAKKSDDKLNTEDENKLSEIEDILNEPEEDDFGDFEQLDQDLY